MAYGNASGVNEGIFTRRESRVRSYARNFPVRFVKAEGARLTAQGGELYIDFLAGCASLNYGHNHPALKAALIEYIERNGVAHSLDMETDAKAAFLENFESLVLRPRGLDYVVQFPGPTGANAVEAALKLARKATGRRNVIAFTNGFHGVTLGALSCTGNSHHRGGAGVSLGDVTHVPYDNYYKDGSDTAAQLDRMLSDPSSGVDAPAAIIVETVQGEGGLNAASFDWLRKIEKLARRHEALFIVDDIQAGVGRAGSFFSFESVGLKPDIVTLAKSISGYGLPMALTLIRRDLDLWKPGEHNGTFRGNCHAFVTAAAAIEFFWRDRSFEESIGAKGELVKARFERIAERHSAQIAGVKGRGMMLGLDMRSGARAGAVVKESFARGLVIETSGPHDEIVKCLAPLTIEEGDLVRGLEVLEASVESTIARELKEAA
ncbi:MAG: diaminobutyrate--2-oxoglutarate transaminase [Alphaproteobacteria bacterium]|nr:diaminobutyrate--2-oxoglutarate transaminase [Alphaproteobacteria bacterium]